MSQDDRELMKQNVEEGLTLGQPHPPPMPQVPEIAETLRFLEKVSRIPDIRFDKVQRMRDLIARGELETPERVDGTVRRLIKELGL